MRKSDRVFLGPLALFLVWVRARLNLSPSSPFSIAVTHLSVVYHICVCLATRPPLSGTSRDSCRGLGCRPLTHRPLGAALPPKTRKKNEKNTVMTEPNVKVEERTGEQTGRKKQKVEERADMPAKVTPLPIARPCFFFAKTALPPSSPHPTATSPPPPPCPAHTHAPPPHAQSIANTHAHPCPPHTLPGGDPALLL